MSSPQMPDDPNTPRQPPTPAPAQPGNTGAAPAMPPPGAYPPPAPGYPPQGTYPPAPPSAPLQPGYYYVPASALAAPPTRPARPTVPVVEPTPGMRKGFLIAGIGGAATFLAYFMVYQNVYSILALLWGDYMRGIVPLAAILIGVLGFYPGARNRASGWRIPRNGALAIMISSAIGLLTLFIWRMRPASIGFWIMALGLAAGVVGGWLAFRETQPASGQPAPKVEPTRNIRRGFLIAGIGGVVAFFAYLFLPYASPESFSLFDVTAHSVKPGDPVWFVLVAAVIAGVLGLPLAKLGRPYSVRIQRTGAIAAMATSALGILTLFIQWAQLNYDGTTSQDSGFWLVALGLGAGVVGGALVLKETWPVGASAHAGMTSPAPAVPLPPNYGAPVPAASYGVPVAPIAAPIVAAPPAARLGFLLAGLGGAAALIAYIAMPYLSASASASDTETQSFLLNACGACTSYARAPEVTSVNNGLWLIPLVAVVLGVISLISLVRNRADGPFSSSVAANVATAGSVIGLLVLFDQWLTIESYRITFSFSAQTGVSDLLGFPGVHVDAGASFGFWVMVVGLGAGALGGWLASRAAPKASAVPAGAVPLVPVYVPPSVPLPPHAAGESMGQQSAPMPMAAQPPMDETPGGPSSF